jgi:methionyl-tRNA synthetase
MSLGALRGKKFFLTPVCLVPNGRAHLGHVAGPLLKMDVLRRHLLRAGAHVKMISLSDVHEAHVLIKAYLEGTTPEIIANRFHEQISRDLTTLGIDYDDLINPLDPAWAETYKTVNVEFLDSIIKAGNAVVRKEPLPILAEAGGAQASGGSWRPQLGDPIVSGWLKGRCPVCEQPLVGFFCESCGGHFAPSEMIQPGAAYFPGNLRFEDRSSLFLCLKTGAKAILDHLEKIRVRGDFFDLAKRYLCANGPTIRLTVHSPWGIPFEHPGVSSGQAIFSYSALLIGCHFVAGERYRQLVGSDCNPLDRESDVTCVLSFGIDNAVPFLVGAVGCALGQHRYKPMDHFLVNYFYDLDGSKFSTSRGHVIWGGDIVTLGGAKPDLVRAYLCWRNPEFGRHMFRADEFLQFHNELGARIDAVTAESLRAAGDADAWDPGVMRYLEAELEAQSACLHPDTFDLAGAFASVDRWLHRVPALNATPESAAAWLFGFALLASPILPDAAQRVWSALALPGSPTVDGFDFDFSRPPAAHASGFRSLNRTQLNVCLPASLRR